MSMKADVLSTNAVEWISQGPDETREIGRLLGAQAGPGDVILLVGDLGAGKTCLTQGILWGLGSEEYVRSPTFVLIAEYQGRLPVYHMDLFRLDSPAGVFDLGMDEYFDGDGVCLVEWADRAAEHMPRSHLAVRMESIGECTRRLELSTTSPDYGKYLQTLREPSGMGR